MRSLIDIRSFGYRGGSIQVDALFVLTSLVVVVSLLLGGGTRPGFLSDVILQLTAVPLLILALGRWLDAPFDARTALARGVLRLDLTRPARSGDPAAAERLAGPPASRDGA